MWWSLSNDILLVSGNNKSVQLSFRPVRSIIVLYSLYAKPVTIKKYVPIALYLDNIAIIPS